MYGALNDSFEELYKTHYRRVFGLCRYLLRSSDDAADAAQEVFLRARSKIESYDRSLRFSTWILGIASHLCIDILRRRGVETRLFGSEDSERGQPADAGSGPLDALLISERAGRVRRVVVALPEKFRVPLVLAYYNEMSYDEIATILNLNRNHVATLIFRGKNELRRMLAAAKTEGGAK